MAVSPTRWAVINIESRKLTHTAGTRDDAERRAQALSRQTGQAHGIFPLLTLDEGHRKATRVRR